MRYVKRGKTLYRFAVQRASGLCILLAGATVCRQTVAFSIRRSRTERFEM